MRKKRRMQGLKRKGACQFVLESRNWNYLLLKVITHLDGLLELKII